jgi:hypothetical protein
MWTIDPRFLLVVHILPTFLVPDILTAQVPLGNLVDYLIGVMRLLDILMGSLF